MATKIRKNEHFSLRKRWIFLRRTLAIASLTTAFTFGVFTPIQAQNQGRWLEINRLSGSVTYHNNGSRAAQVGDRLNAPGQGLSTAARASVILTLDTAIGTINVAESTDLTVRRLDTLGDGGRVTLLDIPRGQARIQVRSFTNPSSRLELRSPSGVAAVRGTDFGVLVAEDGRTAVGTDEGLVAVSAQGRTVEVAPDFASIIRPGSPPTEPQPLDRALQLNLIFLSRQGDWVNLEGTINPANRLLWNGEEIPIRRTGRFQTMVYLPFPRSLELTVQNPLGEERQHHYRFWEIDNPHN